MLIKAKLQSIPVSAADVETDGEVAVAHVNRVKKCGNILTIDFIKQGEVTERWFTDKKNFIAYDPVSGEWHQSFCEKAWSCYGSGASKESERSESVAEKYLDSCSGVVRSFAWAVSGKRSDERLKAETRKEKSMQSTVSAFPSFPSNGVKRWLCDKLFGYYIFTGKKEKQGRRCICSKCGAVFYADVNANDKYKCPECKVLSTVKSCRCRQVFDKAPVCVVQNRNGTRYVRWSKVSVKTTVDDSLTVINAEIAREDYYWNIKGPDGREKACYYSFAYRRLKDATIWGYPVELAYIYPHGIDAGFDFPVSVEPKIKDKPLKYCLFTLEHDFREYPETESLLSMGLTNMLPRVGNLSGNGCRFVDMFGINRQYLPLYQKYNLNIQAHMIIKKWFKNVLVSEETLLKIIELNTNNAVIQEFINLSGMTPLKAVNYIHKQTNISRRVADTVVGAYRDYTEMCKELKIELRKKYEKYPLDLMKEHDRLSERLTLIKQKQEEEQRKEQVETIKASLPGAYESSDYVVKIPLSEQEFVKEGQELTVCVGNGTYSRRHFEGKKLIVFVRRKSDPDKAYAVAELDNVTLNVMQFRGERNKDMTKQAKKFLNGYIEAIKEHRTRKAKVA